MLEFKASGRSEYVRLTREFYKKIDPMVRLAIEDWNDFAEDHHRSGIGLPLTITSVCRTVEENRLVGGNPYSAHLDVPEGRRAVDLRSHCFTPKQQELLLAYLGHRWGPYGKGEDGLLYVIEWPHGTGPHFHVNLRWHHALHNFHPD